MIKLPAYRIVYQSLKDSIFTSEYPVGSLLPPEPELEAKFTVSRTTIRHAISLLENEGLIRVQQGRGTEVLYSANFSKYRKFHNITSVTETFNGKKNNFTVRGMFIDSVAPTSEVAIALEVRPETNVYRMQRIICIDDMPFGIATSYISQSIVPNLDKYNGKFTNFYPFLESVYNIFFKNGIETVSATTSDFVESQLLSIKVNSPLLSFTRIAYCSKGPFEYVHTKVKPELYTLSIHMEGPPKEYNET